MSDCKNCKYYNLNERVNDERGKHECYAHILICSPYTIYGGIENIECGQYAEKQGETFKEVYREWLAKV